MLKKISLILILTTVLGLPASAQINNTTTGVPGINEESLEQLLRSVAESSSSLEGSAFDPKIVLNDIDKQDWESFTDKDTGLYDKRIMTQLLNFLVDEQDGVTDRLIVDRVRRGYEVEEAATSRMIDGASNLSQHHFGKAASLAALGSTSCFREVLFPRQIDPRKLIWANWQAAIDDDVTNERWPFARSFDSLARQFFWIEARSLTNRPITSQTWSSFLQQIAKAEIEERFALAPGVLANVPVSDLDKTLARNRLAANLGLPDIPDVDNEEQFNEAIGRRLFEQELNLPRFSFEGSSWRAIYQNIGFRVLEQQLAMPEPGEVQPTIEPLIGTEPTDLSANERLGLMVNRLQSRAVHYKDPRVAFNLPSEDYLPTGDRSDIFTRITQGDPDAFAIAGVYFLADSFELSPAHTKFLVEQVAEGQDPIIDLLAARPVDPNFDAESIFSADTANHPALFLQIGKDQQAQVERQLDRLNENILIALSGNNSTPGYAPLIRRLSDRREREQILVQIATASQADANYQSGFTVANLRDRGVQLLANVVAITPLDIAALELDPGHPDTAGIAEAIDRSMDWESGTVRELIERQLRPPSPATAQLQEKRQLEDGAKMLWRALELPDFLQEELNNYYFNRLLAPAEPDEIIEGPIDSAEPSVEESSEELPSDGERTGITSEPIEGEEDTGEEVINFALAPEEQPLALELRNTTQLPLVDTAFFLSGQMMPAMQRATLAVLGREVLALVGQEGPGDQQTFLNLFNDPSFAQAEPLIESNTEMPLVRQSFFTNTETAIETNDLYLLWKTTQAEAIYQWNLQCPEKLTTVKDALNKIVGRLVTLPDETVENNLAPRPVQIILFDKSILGSEVLSQANEVYPNADGETSRWGIYSAPRAWDQLYIAY